MSATVSTTSGGPTLEELFRRFGAIPARRIRTDRYPATEQDVLEAHAKDKRLYELVDDVLVEKAMGYLESVIAANLIFLIRQFLSANNLGTVAGEGGMMKLAPGLVRIPDVSFASWSQFPDGKPSRTPIPSIYPDIAVEVLSEGNTAKEMEEKRNDYFDAGTRLVWIIDPDARTLAAYTPPGRHAPAIFSESELVSGDPVLPGFSFQVAKLFA